MCGILGYFSKVHDFNPRLFAVANNLTRYRGPDGFGYTIFEESGAVSSNFDEHLLDVNTTESTIGAFGFRRLSIIDLSVNGNQPMCDAQEKLWIIFNGEIYNYIELKKDLIEKGYTFYNKTDTEVILNSYYEWGDKCVDHFNGMFSFCIFDLNRNELFCARDRLGIKPFYYYYNSNHFVFSSEIKQCNVLVDNGGRNLKQIFDFLLLGSYGNYDENTYFHNIKSLCAGNILKLNLTTFKIEISEYWSLNNVHQINPQSTSNVYLKIKELLFDSTRLRLRSDVPVGTALSGGLDSSGLVCILNSIYKGQSDKNKVFTIISDDPSINDPHFAKIITDTIPVTPYTSNISSSRNILELPKFIFHQEEPLQSISIFGSFYLYQFIKQMGVTVVIDGQGADEFMGGYYRFPYKTYHLDLLQHLKIKKYFSEVQSLSDLEKTNSSLIHFLILKGYLVNSLKTSKNIYFHFKLRPIQKYFKPDFFKVFFNNSDIINKKYFPIKNSFDSTMKQDSYVLAKHSNLPGILRQVDRNSMAASVEARVPFLDYRLVEFLFSLPFEYMFHNGFTKYAYRESMRGLIPEKVLWRRSKEGFKLPEYDILEKNKEFVFQVFNSNLDNDYINVSLIKKLFSDSLSNKSNYNNLIWRTLTYLIWENVFK